MDLQKEKELALHEPFDVKRHARLFINYCEVNIWPDGKIEYAIPSHNECLIQAYMKLHNLIRDAAMTKLNELGYDWYAIVMKETGIVQLWYNCIHNETRLTKEQLKALAMLLEHNCICASAFDTLKVF